MTRTTQTTSCLWRTTIPPALITEPYPASRSSPIIPMDVPSTSIRCTIPMCAQKTEKCWFRRRMQVNTQTAVRIFHIRLTGRTCVTSCLSSMALSGAGRGTAARITSILRKKYRNLIEFRAHLRYNI